MRHQRTVFSLLLGLALAGALAGPAGAAGLLAPDDETLPPLRVSDHLVDAQFLDGVARTTVTQTFVNDTSRRLEATYVFPLPEDADLTDFRMTVGGKMVKGEVLPAEEALRIYERIVRQAKDPGLIECIGRRLLRMRVFPIEPKSETTIELRYQQICRPVSGMRGYHYPLRTRKTAGQAYGTVRFAVTLETAAPLKNIWSPTHAVEIVRQGDERRAKIAYEATRGSLEDDFLLLFSTDSSDLGLSVVAGAPGKDAPGHFVLMLTPKQLWPEEKAAPQDVVFVIDTSGSMAGAKIAQAKSALGFCIDSLDERDRFSVVRFSTGFDELAGGLEAATRERRTEARQWVDAFTAAGGTNIADTMDHVVGLFQDRALREPRPFVVVFITDGRGNRGPEEIMNRLADRTKEAAGLRVFPFGVGHDVNTKLLDRLADSYTGRTTYVQPGESLELVLGDFFAVISRPVLTDLRLELPGIGATERFPAVLGDLYHGQQIILAGCFTTEISGPVRLGATRGGERIDYVWNDVAFTGTDGADYVAAVWAGRKIAYLIDQIRTHGESTEMIAEVLALSREYGIQTPYTSWFVDGRVAPEEALTREQVTRLGLAVGDRRGGVPLERLRSVPGAGGAMADGAAPGLDGELTYGDDFDGIDVVLAGQSVTAASGRVANLIARKNAAMRARESRDEGRLDVEALPVQRIGGRWFQRIGRLLVDEGLAEETEIITVRFASEAWFELVRRRADLRAALAAGRDVLVMVSDETAILVSDRVGIESFSEDQRELPGLGRR